ncbi:hypothetical protein J6590_080845 [Homalodisca vitripennis]|nr:hypothetical protein J6590_080845 [Homalodisca vitripennis]
MELDMKAVCCKRQEEGGEDNSWCETRHRQEEGGEDNSWCETRHVISETVMTPLKEITPLQRSIYIDLW